MDRENFSARQTHIDNLWRMVAFCENKTDCRRALQLSYFGENFDRQICKSSPQTICDNCSSSVCVCSLSASASVATAVASAAAVVARTGLIVHLTSCR